MDSFFRYISYIDLYENNTKIKNAGFLRWKYQHQKHKIEINIKVSNKLYGNFSIQEKKSGIMIGKITLDQGIGNYIGQFSSLSDDIYFGTENRQLSLQDIQGFYIRLNDISYFFVPVKLPIHHCDHLPDDFKSTFVSKETSASENIIVENYKEMSPASNDVFTLFPKPFIPTKKEIVGTDTKDQKKVKILNPIHEDKWQELKKKYPNVHPFPHKICFLSIKPDDFIILQKSYQKLVQNSFLLHGFYNYGHLILGKLSEDENAPFYVGVPGVYYDREKQAAQIFGFTGFESTEQPVQAGSYGYYMIEVMI